MTLTQTASFVWADGRERKVPAEVVAAEVERLAAADPSGVCTAQAFVDAARPKRSPLHALFDAQNLWDDEAAAEIARRDYARNVIAAVRIVYHAAPQQEARFVRIRVMSDEGVTSGYKATGGLTLVEWDAVEQEALESLNALRRRYGMLKRFRSVWDAIDSI